VHPAFQIPARGRDARDGLSSLHDVEASRTMTPLFDAIVAFLDEDHWSYELQGLGDDRRVHFTVAGEHTQLEVWGVSYESTARVCFYAKLPAVVPADKRAVAAEFLMRVNHGVLVGNFELDFDDGEVRFKTSADVEGVELSSTFFKNLLLVNLATADRYFPGLMKVLYAGVSPADAVAIVRSTH
jgi:hypothetical protein